MKQNPHVIGVDDGPFSRGQERVSLAGVLVRAPMYVERVVSGSAAVDGRDATDAVAGLVDPGMRDTAAAIMVDGICIGGFNILDLPRLADMTGLPVVTVSPKEPDTASMVDALKKHFDDWGERAALLEAAALFTVDTGEHVITCSAVGMDDGDASELVRRCVVQGAVPEPVRLAHLIAGGALDWRK